MMTVAEEFEEMVREAASDVVDIICMSSGDEGRRVRAVIMFIALAVEMGMEGEGAELLGRMTTERLALASDSTKVVVISDFMAAMDRAAGWLDRLDQEENA